MTSLIYKQKIIIYKKVYNIIINNRNEIENNNYVHLFITDSNDLETNNKDLEEIPIVLLYDNLTMHYSLILYNDEMNKKKII